jgi:hypothetical protein
VRTTHFLKQAVQSPYEYLFHATVRNASAVCDGRCCHIKPCRASNWQSRSEARKSSGRKKQMREVCYDVRYL